MCIVNAEIDQGIGFGLKNVIISRDVNSMLIVLDRAAAQSLTELGVAQHPVQGEDEVLASIDQQPAVLVHDGIGVAGDARRDRGRPARARLRDRHAPSLARGRAGDDPRAPVQVQELLVGHVTREPDPAIGAGLTQLRLEVVAPVPLADDHRLEPGVMCLDPDEDLDQLLTCVGAGLAAYAKETFE